MRFRTPFGNPASSMTCANLYPMTGASLGGFSTIVFPVSRARVLIPINIAAGKLNGAITPHTPYGFITLLLLSVLYALQVRVQNTSLFSRLRYVSLTHWTLYTIFAI